MKYVGALILVFAAGVLYFTQTATMNQAEQARHGFSPVNHARRRYLVIVAILAVLAAFPIGSDGA